MAFVMKVLLFFQYILPPLQLVSQKRGSQNLILIVVLRMILPSSLTFLKHNFYHYSTNFLHIFLHKFCNYYTINVEILQNLQRLGPFQNTDLKL